MKVKKFNCAPSLGSEVKLPTRKEVHGICNDLKHKIVDQVFSVNDAVDEIGRFIAKRFRVSVLHAKAWEVDPTDININAFYDPELDERSKPSIELVLVTNPNDDHLILDEATWNTFVNRLADTLAHELIHMQQARNRSFIYIEHRARHKIELDEDLLYLSDLDEINAYAYNIATELREHKNPIEPLVNPSAINIDHSINLWAYMVAFKHNCSDPVIKRLLKRVYKHLTDNQ